MAKNATANSFYTADSYYQMARQLEKDLPEAFRTYFEDAAQDVKLSEELRRRMLPWVSDEVAGSKNYDGTLSYLNFIWYILTTSVTETSFAVGFDKLRKKYLNKRRYFVNKTKKEYASRSGTLYEAAREYESSRFGGRKAYHTADEFARDYQDKIIKWASEKDALLIGYPLEGFLAPAKRVDYLEADLSYRCLLIIRDTYNSNPVSGYKTSMPRKLMESGVFSGFTQDTDADLDYDYGTDKIEASEKRSIENRDGTVMSTKLSAGIKTGLFPDTKSRAEQMNVIQSLRSNGSFDIQSILPDAFDQAIFVYIYSSFTMDSLSQGRKIFALDDLVNGIDKKKSTANYFKVLRHLDRLMRNRMDYGVYTPSHQLVEAGTIYLFSRIGYRVEGVEESEALETDFSMQDNTSSSSYIDDLEKCDPKKLFIAIEPSPFLKDIMIKALNEGIVNQYDVNILTRDYRSVSPDVGNTDRVRLILMMLQEERTMIYPQTEAKLTYSFFAQRLHMEKVRNARLKAILDESFAYLKKQKILLRNYSLRDYSIILDFYPFSEEEQTLLSGTVG